MQGDFSRLRKGLSKDRDMDMTYKQAMDMLEHAIDHLNGQSYSSYTWDAYHDAERILRAACGFIGTERTIRTRTQHNNRVVVETIITREYIRVID